MLGKIAAVATRDFLAVVRTKGFVIGLFFMPGVILLSSYLPKLLDRFAERGERKFAVADFTGELASGLPETVAKKNAEPGRKLTIALELVDVASRDAEPGAFAPACDVIRAELEGRVRRGELFGYVVVGPRALEIPPPEGGDQEPESDEAKVVYGAKSLTVGELKQDVRDVFSELIRGARLASVGVDRSLVGRIDRRVELDEFVVRKEASEKSSGAQEALIPMGLVILLLMGVMQSAGLLLTSTIEEKSNRVVEVLMSSVSPFELLAGKVFGAWLVGLVMLLAWGGAGLYTANEFHVLSAGMASPGNLAWFIYFFLTGYLLFASLYVSIGAMCSSIQDAQNMMLPVILLIMIPMFSLAFVLNHPDSGLAVALTWFPFSAPFMSVLRLTLSPPAPQWQIVLAAASVAVGSLVLMWLGGKVFRTAILMTGKPPKPSDVWRMLREA